MAYCMLYSSTMDGYILKMTFLARVNFIPHKLQSTSDLYRTMCSYDSLDTCLFHHTDQTDIETESET